MEALVVFYQISHCCRTSWKISDTLKKNCTHFSQQIHSLAGTSHYFRRLNLFGDLSRLVTTDNHSDFQYHKIKKKKKNSGGQQMKDRCKI